MSFYQHYASRIGVITLPFLSVFVAGALASCTTVEAGHVGLVNIFGDVKEETLPPGFHLVRPWASVKAMSLKTKLVDSQSTVPSKEGLSIGLDISILHRLEADRAREMFTSVGLNYEDVLLVPQIQSALRDVTSGYESKALYTQDARIQIMTDLRNALNAQLNSRGIIVEQVQLRNVRLPGQLQRAIEQKLRAEQESQQMQFVLLKEEAEAKRKEIEAHGIKKFQTIVSEGVSERLLQWKGIEATEKLASSANSKIVIVGGRENGLPLILNS